MSKALHSAALISDYEEVAFSTNDLWYVLPKSRIIVH
jgi:hypothetical protein